jgi:glutamyl-tRNA reductase
MGQLIMVGLSHHAAPLEVRERVAIDEERWRAVAPAALPSVLLSTCNRLEIYAWVEEEPVQRARRRLERALADAAGLAPAELRAYLRHAVGRDAVLHLVRVAVGLDSLVVGEDQIRGQVREALRQAEQAGPLPAALRGVFQRAGEVARRVRGATRLSQHPSIAAAGVHAAAHVVGRSLAGQCVIVLGAGVMAKAAIESLLRQGAHIVLLNRTPSHAEQLAARVSGEIRVGDLERLPELLPQAELLVGATASRQPVVDHATVEAARAARDGRPLVLLDIAVPRDIEPSVRELEGVHLIDLDDLEQLCPIDVAGRRAELDRAEALAADEAGRLAGWLRQRASSPAIAELRAYAEEIRARELRRAAPRLRDLTPEQAAAIDALTTGIIKKLLHGPTLALREGASRPGGLARSRTLVQRVLRLDQNGRDRRPARGRST